MAAALSLPPIPVPKAGQSTKPREVVASRGLIGLFFLVCYPPTCLNCFSCSRGSEKKPRTEQKKCGRHSSPRSLLLLTTVQVPLLLPFESRKWERESRDCQLHSLPLIHSSDSSASYLQFPSKCPSLPSYLCLPRRPEGYQLSGISPMFAGVTDQIFFLQ